MPRLTACILLFLTSFLCVIQANATYQISLLNNTPEPLLVKSICPEEKTDCRAYNTAVIKAYQRNKAFTINYDQKIKNGRLYDLKSYFALKDTVEGYFNVTLKGDAIGSHIQAIDLFINGENHHLLSATNDGKITANKLGSYTFITAQHQAIEIYATTLKDRTSLQKVDSIYLAISMKPEIFKQDNAPNSISLASYNIQAFPFYIGVALDLNKTHSRIAYLSNSPYFKDFDAIAFQEAWAYDVRNTLINNMKQSYPYFYDPIPQHTHLKPLNSGLLILSKWPILTKKFLNYTDTQTLTDADFMTNKGVLYIKINKNGQIYHIFATHTQAQDTEKAIQLRQREFRLIEKFIYAQNIPTNEPVLLLGDLNTDYYNKNQYQYFKQILKPSVYLNTQNKSPKYSYDADLNMMIDPNAKAEYGLYDYISPLQDYRQPIDAAFQVTPIRALDKISMYQRSWLNSLSKVYAYGNVEISDH
ncbi:sphingomyelin phosphodiesterase [Facilibium subflavum]|uniref:sphingomyelin phosphodiesterase n=1 Tax=Facilibium subflavum TaxID=2219058 RepID=UPI000E65DEAC|nr:sphingomyelin phosphodiesterase [Facilibium subflavum]